MVRLTIYFVIVFLLQSCFCLFEAESTEFGQARKKQANKYNFDVKLLQKIDTLSLYEELLYYETNGKILERYINHGKSFLRFYNNGKFSYFTRVGYDEKKFKSIPNYRLTRSDFNPLKSEQGYYYSDGNELFIKIITWSPGITLGIICETKKIIQNLTIKGDTIVLSEDYGKNYYSKDYYVKRKVDKELLIGWKPDW